MGRPSRSEKYLAAIAAGKWVLHTSYLDTSQKEHAFVEVSVELEWDNYGMRMGMHVHMVYVELRIAIEIKSFNCDSCNDVVIVMLLLGDTTLVGIRLN